MDISLTDFSFIDFAIGFIMAEAMIHVVLSRALDSFPALIGNSPKANLIQGLVMAFIAVDIYAYNYGLQATLNNGLIVGAFDMILLYALFGKFLHNKVQLRAQLRVQQRAQQKVTEVN